MDIGSRLKLLKAWNSAESCNLQRLAIAKAMIKSMSPQIAGGSQLPQGNTLSQSCLKVLNLSRNNLVLESDVGPWLFDEHLNLQN